MLYLNNEISQPVTSGGVLFYRLSKGHMDILVIDSRGNFEDLGGKLEDGETLYDGIAREVYEESNGKIKKKSVRNRLEGATYFYSVRSKYVLYVIHANDREKLLTQSDFGNMEFHDDIRRIIKWIPYEEFTNSNVIKHKLNWRMRQKELFEYIGKIKKESILSTCVIKISKK